MGLAQVLTQMGHKCVFVVNQCWPQVVSEHGFESRIFVDEKKDPNESASNEFMVKYSESLAKVLPVFGDQYDNDQRIQEKKLGFRLDGYSCTENELLSTVDKLVNDSQLKGKYKKISERIRTDRTKEKAAQLVVELINKVKQT